MKTLKLIILFSSLSVSSLAQFALTPGQRDSINKRNNDDYNNMIMQIGIDRTLLRQGVSGNPKDANSANTFEEKVNKYSLPDALISKNGKKVKTAKDWVEKRRPEIVADFENEIYGKIPEKIPAVTWQIVSVKDTLIGNQAIKEKN